MNAVATATTVRVLLVDDHAVVRQGLRRILESDPDLTIVGEAADGRAAVEMAERLRPDVVVMDITLPDLNGVEATRQITRRLDRTRVVMLTMHNDDVYIRQSLKAGAAGYLLKDSEELDLLKAIKAVARGESFFSPAASRILLDQYLGERGGKEIEDSLAILTEREREVLQLIAEGQTNREIAATLTLSVNTVETHRKHLMEKLDLHNTAELVRFAIRKKMVQ